MYRHLSAENIIYQILTKLIAEFYRTLVTGHVKDAFGEPMIGVTVMQDGTSNGSVTDLDGNYTLTGVPDNATLKFSYVGFKDQTVSV